MRKLGNAIQQYYGEIVITAPPVTSGLIINGSGVGGSAAALVANGGINQFSGVFQGSATTSFGIQINAGTGAGDQNLQLNTQAGTRLATVFGDGGITVGNGPTGGDQGGGTINVSGGYFVNGAAVGGTTLKIVATATQSIASSTSYTADSVLTLALTAGKYYSLQGMFGFTNASGATGGGAKYAFSYSGTGGSISLTAISSGSVNGANTLGALTGNPSIANNFLLFSPAAIDSAGTVSVFSGLVYGGSAGGNLVLNWAQNTSNVTATIRQTGSFVQLQQLN